MESLYDDLYEGDDHTVLLKKGIRIQDLCSADGEGVEFEVDNTAPAANDEPEYNKQDVWQYTEASALAADDGSTSENEGSNPDNDETECEGPFDILGKRMTNVTEDGGVKKMILSEGLGGELPQNVEVTIHYNGHLEHSDEPFDSTRLRGKPLRYVLGCGEMIAGLELGVLTMKKGEESQFLIKPEYGFGERGCPPRVPGNSTMLFRVELINWVECTELHGFYKMTREERRTCDFRVLKKVGNYFIEQGKSRFANHKYQAAANFFMKAVRAAQDYHPADEEVENDYHKMMLRLYQNLCVCYMQLSALPRVISFAREALQIDPNSGKARYFLGKAWRRLGEFEKAKKELLEARKLNPKSSDVTEELKHLEENMKQFRLAERDMCQRMFAPAKSKQTDTENKPPKPAKTDEYSEVKLDEGFKSSVENHLREFREDRTLMELPLPSQQYSPAELTFIEDKAVELDLDFMEKGEGSNLHVRLYKKQAPSELDAESM